MPMSQDRWSQGVPDDILQLIAQRLYISDYLVFRQVCHLWRAAVDRGIATKTCPPLPQLPWLLIHDSYGFHSGNRDTLDAFYVDKHQYSFLRSPISFKSITYSDDYNRHYVGSIESWLIVAVYERFLNNNSTTVVNYHCAFFNPLSRAQVRLPSDKLFLKKAVASSPPAPATSRMQQNHCFVAGLGYKNRLGICRTTDSSWNLIETLDGMDYKDIEVIDQKLYVAGIQSNNYCVLEYDILCEDDSVTRAIHNFTLYKKNYLEIDLYSLVKDSASKELFIVKRKRSVQVYKMKGENGQGKPSWEEVTDLGDRTLFLSDKSNKVMSDKRLGKNCIYFAFNVINDCSWMYSLTDMSFEKISLPKDFSPQTNSALWFTPHPW